MIERVARVAAPAAVALFVLVGVVQSEQPAQVTVVAAAVAVAVVVAMAGLALQGWPLLAGCLVAGAALTVLGSGRPDNVGWFGFCVLAGWACFGGRLAPAVVFCVVAVAGFVLQAVVISDEGGWGAWPAGTLFTTVACVLAARQRDLLEQLREAQDGLADRTRTAERTRIAHEMHDVIGHALTVTLLHIDSARLALDDDLDVARSSLTAAEQQARRSLEEVRASVGLLRTAGTGDVRPLPGGGDLAGLVDSFRRTGAPVTLDVVGDPASLPAGVGLAAYRIVQEALTNVVRHAPGAPSSVHVEVADQATTLRVDSAGAPGGGVEGNGLAGIRERAAAVGGTASAGPAGAGWRVEAVLPR